MDVSRPAKAADVPEKLVIESRPLIDHEDATAADAGSDIEVKSEAQSAPELPKTDTAADATTPAPSATKKVLTPPTLVAEKTEAPEQAASEPTEQSAAQTEEKPTDQPAAEAEADGSDVVTDDAAADAATKTQRDKDAEDTKKAVEQARRDQEVKEYIENKQFFVPINEVARKRSIKVSFGLVLLMALLGVVLIDLMLDSGIILLIQKIPHTNFFSA